MGNYAMTGGATGIGAAIKQQLLSDGHSITVVDIKNADIEADLSSVDGRQAAIAALQKTCADGLDGFVACAGVGSHVPNKPLIAAVNYYGTTELVDGVRDLLAKKAGSVVLISSNSAPMCSENEFIDLLLANDHEGALALAEKIDGHQVYSGTKQAVARWMRRNVGVYAADKIRINAVAPGYTQTPMTEEVEKDPNFKESIRKFMQTIPIGRPGIPEDMAAATKFLMSEDASFISGVVLFVDGGHDAMLRPDQF